MPKRTHAEAMKTKHQILEAALQTFSVKGFEKTSLSDIARQAGVTRGAVYWHFEDKGDLLCEVCVHLAQDYKIDRCLKQAVQENEPDPLSCIREWMMQHVDSKAMRFYAAAVNSIAESILFGSLGQVEPKTKERLRELFSIRVNNLVDALKHAVRRGQIPVNTDCDAAAAFLNIFILGLNASIKAKLFAGVKDNFASTINAVLQVLPLIRRA